MIMRRSWLKAVLAALGIGTSIATVNSVVGQEGSGYNPTNSIDATHLANLEDQLRFGMRCTRPEQIEYVRLIVNRVETGQIPRAMVNLVYRWALKRNPAVPLPYFQIAMRELARRRGVTLPSQYQVQ
jgi:hypothetical protein